MAFEDGLLDELKEIMVGPVMFTLCCIFAGLLKPVCITFIKYPSTLFQKRFSGCLNISLQIERLNC